MQTLKLSLAAKSVTTLKECHSEKDDDLIDLFPKPRYFQVHFQHIHENAWLLREELAQLKDSVREIDKKLECLLARLS
jgi:hypothetical protein